MHYGHVFLFSTAVRAVVVAKLVMLGVLFLNTFFALKVVLKTK